MRYSDIETYAKAEFTALGYLKAMPAMSPGPATNAILQKTSPNGLVFFTLGGGAGLDSEQLFDRPFITVRAIGRQGDYAGAEKMAWDIDTFFLKVSSNAVIGTAKVLYITRSGGAPQVIDLDSADRYHFNCSYIVETQTGL